MTKRYIPQNSVRYEDKYGYKVQFLENAILGNWNKVTILFYTPEDDFWPFASKEIELATAAHLIAVCEQGVGGVCYAFETLL
jgi:hypothetical protein